MQILKSQKIEQEEQQDYQLNFREQLEIDELMNNNSLIAILKCGICHNIMERPVSLYPCQHNFCQNCFQERFRVDKQCLQCVQIVKQYRPDTTMNRIINYTLSETFPILKKAPRKIGVRKIEKILDTYKMFQNINLYLVKWEGQHEYFASWIWSKTLKELDYNQSRKKKRAEMLNVPFQSELKNKWKIPKGEGQVEWETNQRMND